MIKRHIKLLENGGLKHHQFYDTIIAPDESHFIDYMIKYKDNTSPKRLNKTYYDIEVFNEGLGFDPKQAQSPIPSIAVYNNFKNESVIFATVDRCVTKDYNKIYDGILSSYNELVATNITYNIVDMKIVLHIFKSEAELLESFFYYMRELDTLHQIGFNSSLFDDPYTINRAEQLLPDHKNIISEFGQVEFFADKYTIPDYNFVDLLTLYKPVDSGGYGLGRSLPSYKLDSIAFKELGVTKLELEDGFNDTYINDIVKFLTYNMLDTLLTYKLDEKLLFLEQTFELTKYNNSTMSAALSGRSRIYTYRNNLYYKKQGSIISQQKLSNEWLHGLN